MEYYLAIKNKALTHATKKMSLRNVMLRSQTQRTTYCVVHTYSGMSRKGPFTATQGQCWLPGAGEGRGGVATAEYSVSYWGSETILELERDSGCTLKTY